MGVWPFSMFDGSSAPVLEKITQENKPVLLRAEKEAEKIYKREVWWLEHRTGLRKGSIAFIIIIEIVFGLIGIYAFADYYLIDYVEEQQLVGSFFQGNADLRTINNNQEPVDLKFETARSVQSGQRYDILAFVENGNSDWIAELTYHFKYGDSASSAETIVVNQQTRLPLTLFGIDGARSRSQELVVDNIEWQRLDKHQIADTVLWKTERWNLSVSDIAHETDLKVGDQSFGRTTFNIKNKTGYGYYEVPLTVVMTRGGTLVGVNKTTLSNFQGLEERAIQINWFDTAPSASTVEVFPYIDLFDTANYIQSSSTDELDIRDTIRAR